VCRFEYFGNYVVEEIESPDVEEALSF